MTERALEGNEDRLNALVMTEVRAAREGPRLFALLMALCIVAAFVLGLDGNNIAAGLLLTAPVVAALSRLLPDRGGSR